jgi:hypothetical protein
VKLGTLVHLHLRHGHGTSADGSTDIDYNQFAVGRGYLDVRISPSNWLEARVTPDVSQDMQGDLKLRLKYLFAKLRLPLETSYLSEPYLELGMVDIPWTGFEEQLNAYRMQGTMFAERQGLFSQTDLGVTVGALLGRKLPDAVARRLSEKRPGAWGSLAFGVYNGAGFNGVEKNLGKVVEGRLSVRLLGELHPWLVLSYFFIWGRGNQAPGDTEPFGLPEWRHHQLMLSYAHPLFVATGQFISGKGRQKGEGSAWVSTLDGESSIYRGASGFVELRLPWIWSSLIARYDWFEGPNPSGAAAYHRLIGGFAFHFWGRNQNVLLLDVDWAILEDVNDQWAVSLTLQVKID